MTTYITSQGAANLKKELEFLWSEERPKIVDNVHEAAKNGDGQRMVITFMVKENSAKLTEESDISRSS